MKKTRITLFIGVCLLALFVLWTVLVCVIDVRSVGPHGTSVGFATVNEKACALFGVNMTLYTLTDWLGLVPIATALGFAVLGLKQWIERKSILRVDRSLLVLGAFLLTVFAVYILFEYLVINYRPTLINGRLEASYPSSTTMLVMCVMPAAALELNSRIQNKAIKRCVFSIMALFTVFTVIGRLLSGVHWLTDIIGATLVSAGLVITYASLSDI